MKIRILIVLLFGLCLSPAAFAVRTILYYEDECCRNITEGEFAVLYAQGLKMKEPAQGWTVQSSAAALSSLGHQPEGGWVLSRFLSEAVMARLLKNSPFYREPYNTEPFQRSNILVTISRARGVFPEEGGILHGEFAILLAKALNLPAPQAGWNVLTAVDVLMKQPVPIKPAAGWKVEAALREAEMFQILVNTPFRPTSLDPLQEITPLRAYSLLFGKFEVATEGDFGLFIVQALNSPAPPGGWTRTKALAFVVKEFGLQAGYAWTATTPLCTEIFESALKQIMTKIKENSPHAVMNMPSIFRGAGREQGGPSIPDGASGSESESRPQQTTSATEEFLKEVRRKGLMAGDRCAIVPIQGLVRLQGRLFPLEPHIKPPVSTSEPPQQK